MSVSGNSDLIREPLVFALDTSSTLTSLSVLRSDEVLVAHQAELDQKRSERLLVEVGSKLEGAGLSIADIDLFAVCTGPGSFTGLRVGIAAVAGWAWSLKKPVFGVTSLEASVLGALRESQFVWSMVKGYKGDVYSQLFSADGDGLPMALGPAFIASPQEVVRRGEEDGHLIFAGDAAVAYRGIIEGLLGKGTREVVRDSGTLAGSVARIAATRLARGESGRLEDLKAFYVRPSEAEEKLSKGLLGSKIQRSLNRS